ncbi:uncharacterized protein LOC110373285 [Helicoverpa armigera]|uniref:uncharacterized protein LOC110373285 n=1 Tax=Helicoverpa armigera TaxID=29058 RepID=UPI000B36905D|nr:uncharacterized protein LOC110373285 [Helicoverpa armigera]PZC81011.1 hypothetical protein B5X24_HaOG213533 [Helicoverpa armigera]
MSRCLRIFGAYSFRLTRKHSTILLIGFFILTITAVLQMYAYRHHEHPLPQRRVGDFSYSPGAFLRGRQPGNMSFCMFNYGLPNTLRWRSISVLPSPETGSRSHYGVIYNAITGMAFLNTSKVDAVTYVTQATPEFLYHVVEIAKFWDGPISLATFVPSYDLDIAMQILDHLCHCYPMMAKVSVHLFFPKRLLPKLRTLKERRKFLTTPPPPVQMVNITTKELLRQKLENYRKLNNKTRAEYIQRARKNKIERMMLKLPDSGFVVPDFRFEDCAGQNIDYTNTYRRSTLMMYPINVGRNVARNASTTNYFLVSDIEMVPSHGLAPKFLKMIRKLMGDEKRDAGCVFAKTVFVVPLFEVERGEKIPHEKVTLIQMIATNRATYFHQRVCPHCQRFPGLQTWLMRPSKNVLEPMLIAKREYPYHRWEPLYFGTNKEPWYSEALSWEGRQDKMTQMLEMCLQQYRMVVLDGGFLSHAAIPRSKRHRKRAENINTKKYMKIIKWFKEKYEERQECKLLWGCPSYVK